MPERIPQKMKGKPLPEDIAIGKRLRQARLKAEMSQTDLAKLSGVTFQQIQKYEKGKNRIAASRLLQFAKILNRPIEWFYHTAQNPEGIYIDDDREEIKIYRAGKAVCSVKNPKIRRHILAIAKEVNMLESSMSASFANVSPTLKN